MQRILQLLLLLHFLTVPATAVIWSSELETKDVLPYKEGRLLVRVLDGSPEDALEGTAAFLGAEAIRSYSLVPGLWLFTYDESIYIEDAIEEFSNNPFVLYAEPDYIYHAAVAPNDPRYPELWAMENTGQTGGLVDADVNAESMWQIEDGDPRVVIAVIDTGIDYTHADLIPNVWSNSQETPGDGIDNDGNGYIDDIHGVNAILNNGDPRDDNSHGTHVSGTIGADGNNSLGVVGMAQDAQIVACKFLNSGGSGGISDAIQCMDYLARLKTRTVDPVNIVASNNSWGGGSFSQAMYDAIKAHQNLGILFVAAAGNSAKDTDTTIFYPAGYELQNLISVAATDHNDRLATFSNYGHRTVHVAAPGVRILSTIPNQGYASYSGTSMASPHVTGLIAIIKSRFPALDYRGIKNLVMASGSPIAAAQNTTISGRRIRGADSNGTGALTCVNQVVSSRLRPIANTASLNVGDEILLSAIKINCNAPAGGTITLYSDVNQSVILKDDGLGADKVASDGVYSLSWKPTRSGTYPLNFGGGDIVTVTVGGVTPPHSYKAYNNVAYEYENFAGTPLNAGDDTIHTVDIPFAIHFNGDTTGFQRIYVSSNGTVGFSNATNPGYINKALPTNITPTLVSPFWDDLVPVNGGDVFYAAIGTSPNRKLVVEWRNLKHYNAGGTGTLQVVFYENSPDLRFNYLDTDFGSSAQNFGASATVGVQTNVDAATQYSFNAPNIPSQSSLLFRLE